MKLDDMEVLVALDEAIEREAGHGFEEGVARAWYVARMLGKGLGVAWETPGGNWRPSASAVGRVARALGALQDRGLVVRQNLGYSVAVWSITVQGDELLAEHEYVL